METFCTPLERNLNLFKKLFSVTPQNHLLNFIYFGKVAVTDVHYYTTKTRSECWGVVRKAKNPSKIYKGADVWPGHELVSVY